MVVQHDCSRVGSSPMDVWTSLVRNTVHHHQSLMPELTGDSGKFHCSDSGETFLGQTRRLAPENTSAVVVVVVAVV